VALLFKARQQRRKDEIDLENAWPLLGETKRAWLREAVRRAHPDHPGSPGWTPHHGWDEPG
jgi:hypothetical protein